MTDRERATPAGTPVEQEPEKWDRHHTHTVGCWNPVCAPETPIPSQPGEEAPSKERVKQAIEVLRPDLRDLEPSYVYAFCEMDRAVVERVALALEDAARGWEGLLATERTFSRDRQQELSESVEAQATRALAAEAALESAKREIANAREVHHQEMCDMQRQIDLRDAAEESTRVEREKAVEGEREARTEATKAEDALRGSESTVGSLGRRLTEAREREAAMGKQLTICETSLRASKPAVEQAMDALESDATLEQRRAAWDLLRDVFFPSSPSAPPSVSPELLKPKRLQLHQDNCAAGAMAFFADDPKCDCGLRDKIDELTAFPPAPEPEKETR